MATVHQFDQLFCRYVALTLELPMSNHNCHDEHDEGHSHSHETPLEDVPRTTLYSIIDHQNVLALNVAEQVNVFKTWENRNDETLVRIPRLLYFEFRDLILFCASKFLESDSDDQMIIRIPFVDSAVKLLSILVKAGPGDQTPTKIQLVST